MSKVSDDCGVVKSIGIAHLVTARLSLKPYHQLWYINTNLKGGIIIGGRSTCLEMLSPPEAAKKDAVIHVDSDDVAQLITELEGKGYPVKLRQR